MSTGTRQIVVQESWGPHYTAVLETDGSQPNDRYFIENSPHMPKKPDLTVHRTDSDGPIIGVTQFSRFSSNCDLILVGNDDSGSESQIHMAKKGFVSPSYTFKMTLPIDGETRTLAWKNTRSQGYHRTPHGNIKLVDEKSQEVLAVFSRDGFALVPGCLDIYANASATYGNSFDQISLLTGLSVREQQRRQTTRTVRAGRENVYTMGAAGGGAGGGGS